MFSLIFYIDITQSSLCASWWHSPKKWLWSWQWG